MPAFQYQYLLLVLVLIPVLILMFFFAKRKKKRSLARIGDPELVEQLMGNYKKSSFTKKFLLALVTMLMLVLALANLRLPSGSETVAKTGIDVMIALDVSKSMLAQDVKPTRLDRAKQMLGRLIDKLGNNRVGIVIFAGKAYLQMPLTGDIAAAKMYLSSASTQSVPTQGTVIGDALKMCFASFNPQEKKYKAVVLITDGEDHDETANDIAKQMAAEGVVIYTVGIGSTTGSPIMDASTGQFKTDEQGNTVVSKLNESLLQSVAKNGKGSYLLYSSTEQVVASLTSQLATLHQRTVTEESLMNYRNFFQIFLAVALLLLIVELFVSETKMMKQMEKGAAVVFLVLLLGPPSFAQGDKQLIKEGNDRYKKSDYAGARTDYEKVLETSPENEVAQYNLGNALYKTDKTQEAISAYDKSIQQLSDPAKKSNAYFNKGVVLQNSKKIPDCIEAYKQALRLDPQNEDARQNLQKALQQQKQQQQQQDKDKDKKKQDQPDKDKNKQQQQKPQQSKINKEEAEEKLKALLEKEKNLQDKLRKVNGASANKPEKDW